MPKTRNEKDSLGTIKVPYDAPRGIYTQRVLSIYPQHHSDRVPELFLRTYIEAKMIYATINARFRKIDQEKKRSIHKVWKELLKLWSQEFMSHFPIGKVQSGWGTSTNMMVNEVLANLATVEMGGKLGKYKVNAHDDTNGSQSSNDTFPWVTKLTLIKLYPQLLTSLDWLIKTCTSHARRWKSVKKVWRTHLQDAVVITMWDEFAAYARTLQKNKKYLQEAYKWLYELNFWWTATWSLQNITLPMRKELVRECSSFYKKKFIQPKSYFEQNSSSGDIAWFMQAMTHCVNDCMKIANDLRLLSSWPLAGIHEYELPSVHPWSSIMPGKVNPSVVEAFTMICASILWHNQTVQFLTRSAQCELQQFMPQITWSVIESTEKLSEWLVLLNEHCVKWIKLNKKRIQQLLDWSFANATEYSEKVGYDIVAKAVHEALHSGRSLKDVLGEL